MQDDIRPGKDETAIVERVVPGRLVYVTTKNDEHEENVYGFKLDQLVIRNADGCRPYRGEPLSDLGVASGRRVVVWGLKYQDVEPALVIDADKPREFSLSVGSSISSMVTHTANTIIGKIISK